MAVMPDDAGRRPVHLAKEQAPIHADESDFDHPKFFAELETQNKTMVLVAVFWMLSDPLSDRAT
ncbi:hypothetical protein GCM10010121_081200 [Streptomyces brasiliensis]|uniref:Uncharacterized protein n=2 Tax=Streptomyces brasiliensis TaxID=1954 RepID=A0A917LCL3_9ACTN|nr:hypothetical protein GCM10010121_081200 [Streptomyces brasiliensis]